jgi:hypothetical protein
MPWDDRQNAEEAEKMTAIRALLSGIVDYAGLFPPSSLDMEAAVRNYASYRRDPASWMLGRFVLPIARLDELSAAWSAVDASDGSAWRLAGLFGADIDADVTKARAFTGRNHGRAAIDALEGKLSSASEIEHAAAVIRDTFELFVEIPTDPDPEPLIAEIGRVGAMAKIRTGGVTPDSIPSAEHVVRFIRRCLDAKVPFKATAGLHHPLRADYPLSYEIGAPRGVMFGYLNVFLAAAFMRAGMEDTLATELLDERDPAAVEIGSERITWRDASIEARDLYDLRDEVALSFGSCSFREPVDELRSFSPLV